ncbi:flavodoxin [Lactiplantibacillus garii]|uniref:Flavodoxin n=1 Tax=Lactiplantibacillus garii TaxID=2306423 RepID=A0A426D4A1_9LACO|nr:flavodoxin [Lactiplantibacillus garii]RRK09411.1 flavodoxin [Lactiplantibacillus garii]
MATAKVIFATITGNNEDVADIIIEKLEALGVDVTKEEISQADAAELKNFDINIIVPYTYDEGALPEEGLDFYDDLQDVDLSGKIYGCAGSGDTFYEDDYCRAVTDFSNALKKAGATQGAKDVFVNLAPEADDVKHLDAFAEQIVAAQANA